MCGGSTIEDLALRLLVPDRIIMLHLLTTYQLVCILSLCEEH